MLRLLARLSAWRRSLATIRHPESFAWPTWRWQVAYFAAGEIDGFIPGVLRERGFPQPWLAWLMLPVPMRDTYALPTSRQWFALAWWQWIEGPFWRCVVRLGVWQTDAHGYFRRGRVCGQPWANPRSVWQLRRHPHLGGSWRRAWRGF